MKVDIDDTYSFSMDFGNKYGSVLIDVVARYAIRSLILNTQKAQITWRWDEDFIKISDFTGDIVYLSTSIIFSIDLFMSTFLNLSYLNYESQ
jgi:hypothetical protein